MSHEQQTTGSQRRSGDEEMFKTGVENERTELSFMSGGHMALGYQTEKLTRWSGSQYELQLSADLGTSILMNKSTL